MEVENKEQEDAIVTPTTIDVFSQFAITLKRIHTRLLATGHTIKDGDITEPVFNDEILKTKKHSRRSRKHRMIN